MRRRSELAGVDPDLATDHHLRCDDQGLKNTGHLLCDWQCPPDYLHCDHVRLSRPAYQLGWGSHGPQGTIGHGALLRSGDVFR